MSALMVGVNKNWSALPVMAPTITLGPGIEVCANPPQPSSTYTPDNIQQPAADLVELPEITHNETK